MDRLNVENDSVNYKLRLSRLEEPVLANLSIWYFPKTRRPIPNNKIYGVPFVDPAAQGKRRRSRLLFRPTKPEAERASGRIATDPGLVPVFPETNDTRAQSETALLVRIWHRFGGGLGRTVVAQSIGHWSQMITK